MGSLILHTSNRLEVLLDALADRLASEPLPPLQPETILVPSQGTARWLQLELCRRAGVAASLHLPFPGAFLHGLVRPEGREGARDPFDRAVLTWRIFRLLGDARHGARLGPAARYCEDDPDQRRRHQLAQRLAGCFDDYQLHRDDVLRQWQSAQAGRADRDWQAALWRLLVAEHDREAPVAPAGDRGGLPFAGFLPTAAGPDAPAWPAHRLDHLRRLLASPDAARRLPPRLSVFGIGALPPALLDLLARISAHVPVTLYLPQPTPHFFGDVRRSGTGTEGNPLLAQLGRKAREAGDLLAEEPFGSAARPLDSIDPGTGCALHTLQSDVACLRRRGAGGDVPALPLAADDDSLRLHSCHSPLREVQVLRDQLLDAFARDRSLRPADVLILVPDIDRYAPLVHAVFGPVRDQLPFHVADRSPAAALPLVAALLRVLDLADDRLAAFDVLHLLEESAIARRFELTAADLPVLRSWTARAGIRWGVDGPWRQAHLGLPPLDDFTWEQGLRRLLLGSITGPTPDLVAGIAPVADTTDVRAELLGRFVAFVRTLFLELESWRRPQPLPRWADHLDRLLDRLFLPQADDDAACTIVRGITAELRALADGAGVGEPVSVQVLRAWLDDALGRLGASRGFLTGAITVARLEPMRAIPVRILCVAGLDDASFPRREQPLPFDLQTAERRPGDRDVRAEDRQLFLDTLLAARQRLLLTWVGRSQKDDAECAPSVVVAELCDWLRAAFVPPPGTRGRTDAPADALDWLLVQHPLQSFSPRYRDGRDARLFTFAGAEHDPAGAADPNLPFVVPLGAPAPAPTVVALDQLLRFWVNPGRWWLREVLDVRLPDRDDELDDVEPFGIDALLRWSLQDEHVKQRLADGGPADPLALASARGRLPPGAIGSLGFDQATAEADGFVRRLLAFGTRSQAAVEVGCGAVTIVGEATGVTDAGLVLHRMAGLKTKDQLRAWIQHLVWNVARLAAGLPQQPTRFVARDKTIRFEAMADPLVGLQPIVDGFVEGQRRPLPFYEQSSAAFAEAERKGNASPLRAARSKWLPRDRGDAPFPGDAEDPWIALCTRDREPLADPEFERWARAVWEPLLGMKVDDAD